MEKQKTKLGARILSKAELNAILPNAESVYEQIEVFRNNIPKESRKQQDVEQKTNNIGIMGCRGAGKTSILRTFYENLKRKNAGGEEEKTGGEGKGGDIILPIIVPENMSVGTTLMDVVLGMLKPIVEERKKEKAAWSEDCIYSGRGSLEKQYDELVKQYCYIKKDYRDILIQQFTTEQNYVDKTKEVFNSDSEFIRLLDQFVVKLLQGDANTASNAMIFLFIDDIDLSTNRCMDVVRTLLSYLSNPRIVTFISGDMETFEEALTLEFLRQEEALDAGVFGQTFYSTNDDLNKSKLLERKKTLAYEYLKKIIPPAYRRSIKYWSLEERGSYQITDDEGNGQKNLAQLLVEISKEKVEESYFICKEDDGQKHMELAFHMFDDTSRGLNNVYNVLQELDDLKRKKEDAEKGREMLSLWRLIETMVDAKPLYAKYKAELFKQIIVLEQEQVKINFENAYQFLYGEEDKKKKANKADEGKKNTNEEKGEGNDAEMEAGRFTPEKSFALFFLIDFAAGLFSGEQQEDSYKKLKNRVIQEYLSDERIDGKIASARKKICWWAKGKEKNDSSIQFILAGFLNQGDFIFILYLIRYLGRDEIYDILENKEKDTGKTAPGGTKGEERKRTEKEIAYKVAYALARAVWAISGTEEGRKNYLAELYLQMPEIMQELLNKLSLDKWVIYGRQLTDDGGIRACGRSFMTNSKDLALSCYRSVENYLSESKNDLTKDASKNLLWAEYQHKNLIYWIYYEKVLREKKNGDIGLDIPNKAGDSISLGLTKTIMGQMQEVMTGYEVRELKEFGYDTLSGERTENLKRQVIIQVDEKGLWRRKYAEDRVYKYLRDAREEQVLQMSYGRVILDATEFLTGAYSKLKNCYKGSSGRALVYHLLSKVQSILFLSVKGEQPEESRFSDGKYYLRLEQTLVLQCMLEEFLSLHGRVRYGKREIRQFLMEVRELPLVMHSSEWDAVHEELEAKEKMFFNAKENELKDLMTKKLEERGKLEEVRRSISEKYNNVANGEGMIESLEDEYLNGMKNNGIYFRYLVQGDRIQEMRHSLNESKEKIAIWEDIEPVVSKKDYMFIFHSYLRYLQAHDSDAEKTGTQAEVIATLAKYMLDSEVIADQKIQNEIYEILSQEIEMTEEEFEALF